MRTLLGGGTAVEARLVGSPDDRPPSRPGAPRPDSCLLTPDCVLTGGRGDPWGLSSSTAADRLLPACCLAPAGPLPFVTPLDLLGGACLLPLAAASDCLNLKLSNAACTENVGCDSLGLLNRPKRITAWQ